MIGRIHIIKKGLLITLLVCSVSGCEWFFSRVDPIILPPYRIEISNETDDTLMIDLKPGSSKIGIQTIYPDSAIYYGSFTLDDEDDDVIKDGLFSEKDNRFSDGYVELYRDGELILRWTGPMFERNDSIAHHFFNANSWEYGIDNLDSFVRYTIRKEDLPAK